MTEFQDSPLTAIALGQTSYAADSDCMRQSTKYETMKLPSPVAPTMVTVSAGKVTHPGADAFGFRGAIMQNTAMMYQAASSSGRAGLKHSRMGTADEVSLNSPVMGISRDPINLRSLQSQRDPIVSLAVRGIVPALITKETSGPPSMDPANHANFFKHVEMKPGTPGSDNVGLSIFNTIKKDGSGMSQGVYLPFGNFKEPYKHAFPLHMNSLPYDAVTSNAEIRYGAAPDASEVEKAEADAADAAELVNTAEGAARRLADAAAADPSVEAAAREAEKELERLQKEKEAKEKAERAARLTARRQRQKGLHAQARADEAARVSTTRTRTETRAERGGAPRRTVVRSDVASIPEARAAAP